ncbi:penicillin-binding protein 1C [uncultured Roseibium sp.]|uniref:penicillin-binding protein 1C n=1 Tax=uncultured Roseibium sp. TaxID=1936171 RepID=UPI00374DC486
MQDGSKGQSRWRLRYKAIGLAGAAVACLAVVKVGVDYQNLPEIPKAADLPLSAVVLDRDDRLLRAFTSEDQKWRLPVSLADIDPLYAKMLVAYEDKRFYDHHGVDIGALVRAAGQMFLSGRIVSGGSTLTMQVARLLEEHPTRTIGAKYEQILRAIQIENSLSKDQILSLYMLRAPFGGNLEGVRAASLVWFGKEPSRLTPAEAALLVALPQSPEARRPDRFAARAAEARDRVLERAVKAGVLTSDEAAAARRDRIPDRRRAMPFLAAHAARDAVLEDPDRLIHRLTVNATLQQSLESLVRDRVRALGPHISSAVLVADHQTGEILASVGSPDLLSEARQGHIDMTKAVRSPGSTLKPLIYGLAFEEGVAHPESFIEDRPIDIGGYRPTNFDQAYQGTVTVREALQLSLNTPAVQLLEAVGPARLISRLKRAGAEPVLGGDKAPGLAIGLGGLGLTLTDLTRLYAALARQGQPVSLVLNRDLPRQPVGSSKVLEQIAAWHVADILSGLPQSQSAGTSAIAYKTGTAYGYRDCWAVGFDGRHVVAVWVGRADASPVPGMTGAKAAVPILFEAFQRLGKDRVPLPAEPDGVLSRPTAELPVALRRARVAGRDGLSRKGTPFRIAYPPGGAVVDLGLKTGMGAQPLVVKLEGGKRPYTWLVNDKPVDVSSYRRQLVFTPTEEGFAQVAVIDSEGHVARVDLTLK